MFKTHLHRRLTVRQNKVITVDWLGNLANYKEDYNVSLFMLCARSRLGSFVLGVMLH